MPALSAPLARMRWLGLGVAAVLAVLAWVGSPWHRRVQLAWFDSYQVLAPRKLQSTPAIVVAIDEKSLAELGQWPWPRTLMARLIDRVAAARPAAIGVDLLWPEPDRLSPDAIARSLPDSEAETRARLLALPANDALLAQAIGRAPVVLAIAGAPDATKFALRAAPFRLTGAAEPPPLREYAGVLASLDGIDRAAAGHGLISSDLEGAVVRRMPLVASVAGTLTPGLELEMLRVAAGLAAIELSIVGGVARQVGLGDFAFPAAPDGSTWLHFSPRDGRRFVSAADVIAGRVERDQLERKLVLIGITGLGIVDYQTVATGERMPGVEVHAQLLEMMIDNTPLTRPERLPALEWAAFGAGSALLVWLVPVLSPRRALILGAAVIGASLACGWALFLGVRVLLDAATPSINLLLVFGALLAVSLIETNRRERQLELEVQRQREEAARVAGELEAARRIQTGILPRPDALKSDTRIEIAAEMTPAREVGGDLYDFFPLDHDRLFFLIGDVSGKGLPASIFMAVSKALYKSTALRRRDASADLPLIGELMTLANAEVSRENGEAMFVTLFAGILDLESGTLAYCNAGHDDPYVLHASGATTRLTGGDGPPLCVIDDFDYAGNSVTIAAGDMLCMVTDGVTEAQDGTQALYGGERFRQVLETARRHHSDAPGLLAQLHADLALFVGKAEPADDLTILVLRWKGATAGSS